MLSNIARLSRTYRQTRKQIKTGIEPCFKSFIRKTIKNVKYYKLSERYNKEIEKIPILRKNDIIGKEEQFIAAKTIKPLLNKFSTGGTSGVSMNMYRSYRDIFREWAFVDHAFSLIGNNLKIAVLRGNKPKVGFSEYKNGKLILSSYAITVESIHVYVQALKEYKVNCIHAYPSSLMIFCKCIESNNLESELSGLKGILCSSEIFSMDDKRYVKSIFPNTKIIDLYGQNEHVAFAIAQDFGPYHFYKSYGKTEFVERDELSQIEETLKIKEIVSTGFINRAMPFLRYGTEDFVEIDKNDNVISIIGRSQDYIYDFNKEKLPCIVHTRPKTLKNVISFQYLQEKYGKVIFQVVVNSEFGEKDTLDIVQDFKGTFNDRIEAEVKICKTLQRTKRGKLIRLIQTIKNEKNENSRTPNK